MNDQADEEFTVRLPIIALRGLVLFPGMRVQFDIARQVSVQAAEYASRHDRRVFLVAQKDPREEEPRTDDLYTVGVVAKIDQAFKTPGDGTRLGVQGICRATLLEIFTDDPCQMANVVPFKSDEVTCTENYKKALLRRARALFSEYAEASPRMAPDVAAAVEVTEDLSDLADFIGANLPLDVEEKQKILAQRDPLKRMRFVLGALTRERQILEIDSEISEKVHERINENQREYYLREQMNAIKDELFGEDDPYDEAEEYRAAIEELPAPEEVKTKLLDDAERLAKMPPGSHEAATIEEYLDIVLDLPWGVYSKDRIDMEKARRVLEKSHYGLKDVKQRVLETLAVRGLSENLTGQVLCLVGPPGVGKTSIGQSVARCMGRKFARVSLGGVSDESEIRGHRRTYVGSMPGRIIDAVKRAGTCNPVVLLDEVDKLCVSYHGDPSSALLEALDPEQNSTFKDHYLDVPFDLSKVLFITTANTLDDVPAPLVDRMEVITIPGYTREDKFRIAKEHLAGTQLKRHGLTRSNCKISDDAIYGMIDFYTRESGVRQLDRLIGSLCRKAAYRVMCGEKTVKFTAGSLRDALGVEKYRADRLLPESAVGIVNGLAWTAAGGEIMQLEAVALKGTGKTEMTGSLGDVMKESVFAAVTYVRAHAGELGVDPEFYKTTDLHIHATEAAVPKDGPSAGVTIVTAAVSALTGRRIRRDIAMTGEVTISGRVLPIGGLREKSMAAYSAGVGTVFIPEENVRDLEEVDPVVKDALTFVPVKTVDEILAAAFEPEDAALGAGFSVEPAGKAGEQAKDKPGAAEPLYVPKSGPSRPVAR